MKRVSVLSSDLVHYAILTDLRITRLGELPHRAPIRSRIAAADEAERLARALTGEG
jgi:hypothetical protein